MSMQIINLYLPELRPKKEWLTADSLAISLGGFLLLMIFAVVMNQRGLERYENQLVSIENQVLESSSRVEKIKKMPRTFNALELDLRLAELKKSISGREQIGQIIQGQNLGNESGFSASMEGLSRQALTSISLQHFRISRGGSFIELKGRTKNAQDIPKYIQNLRNEPSFDKSVFGLLSVAQELNKAHRQFSLGFDSVYQIAAEPGGD